jgi:type III pantothenate kinase
METLLVDIGNTHLKWAVLAGERRSETQRINHQRRPVGEALAECWRGLVPPGRILAASVGADEVNVALASWTTNRWGLSPRFLSADAEALGVTNGYDEPAMLGVDRWLGLIAVRRQTALPAVIADCGTAVTLDALDSRGKHLGGLILPGLEMMHRALFEGTNIPLQELPRPDEHLGRATSEAVASGSGQAIAALIDRLLTDIASQSQTAPVLVLTGSDAPRIQPLLRRSGRFEPDLVMQGLHTVAEQMERI